MDERIHLFPYFHINNHDSAWHRRMDENIIYSRAFTGTFPLMDPLRCSLDRMGGALPPPQPTLYLDQSQEVE